MYVKFPIIRRRVLLVGRCALAWVAPLPDAAVHNPQDLESLKRVCVASCPNTWSRIIRPEAVLIAGGEPRRDAHRALPRAVSKAVGFTGVT